jgi:hypothetical protein
MKLATSFIIALLSLSMLAATPLAQDEKQSGDKFVYADFEKAENGRAVTNAGGLVQIYTAQESTPVKYKGLANANPGAPELIVLKDAPQNHLAAFEYNLIGPNQWANVTLEIQGRPLKEGKPVADDVTGYKQLSLQLYATGVDSLRVEFVSHGQGINITGGFPQLPVRLKPGLNTYVIPLKGLSQPTWVQREDRVDTKEVLKKLTAISISAYCDQCTPQTGMVLVDNLVFQK